MKVHLINRKLNKTSLVKSCKFSCVSWKPDVNSVECACISPPAGNLNVLRHMSRLSVSAAICGTTSLHGTTPIGTFADTSAFPRGFEYYEHPHSQTKFQRLVWTKMKMPELLTVVAAGQLHLSMPTWYARAAIVCSSQLRFRPSGLVQ